MSLLELHSILQTKYTENISSHAMQIVTMTFHIGSFCPVSPRSDYIENKTTMGGESLNSSMYNNPFSLLTKSGSSVHPTTTDLNFVTERPQRQIARSQSLHLIR